MRATVYLAIFAVILLALLGACAPAAPSGTTPTGAASSAPAAAAPKAAQPAAATPAAKIKRGGILNYATQQETSSWDPILASSGRHMVPTAVLENLIEYVYVPANDKHELQPQLAESWEITDPTTIVLKLRKGVKFHDGSDFNAEVAKWNLERARDKPTSRARVLTANMDSFEVVDPLTLKMKLKRPSSMALLNLTSSTGGSGATGTIIVSKAAAEQLGEESIGTKPIGTGPQSLVEWRKDDRAITKRFDGYWGKGADGQPLPYLDGINARIISDPTVMFTELRSGTVDVSPQIAPSDYPAAKANPNLTVQVLPWANEFFIFGFNQKSTVWGDNLKLRQAAQYAVDRKNIAAAVGFGLAEPDHFWFWGPGFVGYDTSLPHYEYDLEKAKQLMKDAGYPDGVDTEILTFPSPVFSKPAEILQQMWAKVGIRAKVDLIEMVAAKAKMKVDQYEVGIESGSPSPDPAYMARLFTCPGTANVWNYCSAEMDKCMAEAEVIYDNAEREKIYKRCQRVFYEDAYMGGLHQRNEYFVWRNEVKGVRAKWGLMDLSEAWLDR